jgi:uncharacterized protein
VEAAVKIIVAGGSGLIGRRLVSRLAAAGHEPVVLSRRKGLDLSRGRAVQWDGRSVGDWAAELAEADAIVNLAGESVGSRRWTRRRKRAILESRVDSTAALVDGLAGLPEGRRPRVLVNASGIDHAGPRGDEPVAEDAPPGESFLSSVCAAWEEQAYRAAPLDVRVVLVRTPFVVAREAPALRLLALPFRLFLGGRLGDGRQWFPWIHVDDLVAVYCRAVEDGRLVGPLNAVAPDLPRQHEVARALGRVLHRPAVVAAPAPLLRLVMGEQADLLLHGQRAISRRLDDFEFRYPELRGALEEALR